MLYPRFIKSKISREKPWSFQYAIKAENLWSKDRRRVNSGNSIKGPGMTMNGYDCFLYKQQKIGAPEVPSAFTFFPEMHASSHPWCSCETVHVRVQNCCSHEPGDTGDPNTDDQVDWTSLPWVLLEVTLTLAWRFLPQYLAEQSTIKTSKLLNVLFVGLDQGKALPHWLAAETCFGVNHQ